VTDLKKFRAVYETAGVYDRRLLAHYYHGVEDLDLVTQLLKDHYGQPAADLKMVEFGCGTGRITTRLVPYARRLIAADYSSTMIGAVQARLPQTEAFCADTRKAVAHLRDHGLSGTFDVVAAFWSLSYPLGEFFETMTARGIQPVDDVATARKQAAAFVRHLVNLLAPGGHLLALFFDSETLEQRLVTRVWERVAPFPEGGRSYTLNVLLDGLRQAEADGRGALTHVRYGGTAWAPDRDAALAWFNVVHLKSSPVLVNDPEVQRELVSFVERYVQPGGDVTLPSGVHVIDFHALPHPACHLPEQFR
jgi:SAM-dependent methyltransferase